MEFSYMTPFLNFRIGIENIRNNQRNLRENIIKQLSKNSIICPGQKSWRLAPSVKPSKPFRL
jgi:hypothetical protein